MHLFLQGEGAPPDTTFIEDGVHELLKTRRILKCSYPYSFFLEPKSTKKEIFELMQVLRLISIHHLREAMIVEPSLAQHAVVFHLSPTCAD